MKCRARVLGCPAVIVVFAAMICGLSCWAAAESKGHSKHHPDMLMMLDLGGASFDPLHEAMPFPEHLSRSDETQSDLRLVQFHGPIRDEWLGAMRERGLEIIQYIHPNTYIVWGDPAQLQQVHDLEPVRWWGDFAPACRLLPHLRNLDRAKRPVRVLAYRGGDIDAIVQSMHDLGAASVKRRVVDGTFEVIGCDVDGDRLEDIARIPGVYTVQPIPEGGGDRAEIANQVNADNFDGSTLEPGYYEWLESVGITGNNVILASVDGGIYVSHPDLVNRIVDDCIGESCGDGTISSHGTLVAGVLAGDAASDTSDSWGFLAGQGVAPRASILEQLYAPIFSEPDGMLRLMTDSWRNGAVASSNSWGPSPTPLGYDLDTRLVDIGVRDSDPEASGSQPLSYVLSIMNGGGGTSTQGTPDEALNILSVGASRLRSQGGVLLNSIDDISSVSAHGPCLDGRMLPDMVAPGCYVLSTYTPPWNYNYACGTSMACPQVAGALGLFTEYYSTSIGIGRDPSPAMAKAAILNVARDLGGNEDADGNTLSHAPNSQQGWGRLQLKDLISPPTGSIRYVDQTIVLGESGDEWSIDAVPNDPSQPMRITLAWTTAPGHGLGGSTPAWTNDLDLVVEASGSTYSGNAIDSGTGWSIPGGAADEKNNVEAVFLGPSPPGIATIRVVASDINSDGIPHYGDATDQDFALICWNCQADPFTLVLDPPAQEVCVPGTIQYSIEVRETGGGNNPVVLQAAGPAEIIFDIEDVVVIPPATTTVSLTIPSGLEGTEEFSIIGTSDGFESSVVGQVTMVSGVLVPPELVEPVDGATDVSTMPLLAWEESEGTSSYEIEVATDYEFNSIAYAASETGTTHAISTILLYEQLYYWRVRSNTACGIGAWSFTSSFTTAAGIKVLLVDDDDNDPDVRFLYTTPLDALGVMYDTWDTNNTDYEPDAITLGAYDLVIWFTGDEWGGYAGPGEAGEEALAAFLDDGGSFWISSQDYLYDRGLTPFIAGYLGVDDYESDVEQEVVTGTGDLFESFGTMTLTCPFNNYTDSIEPGPDATTIFIGDEGDAAMMVENETWRTMFWAFPLEAVLDDSVRQGLVSVVINWVPAATAPCPADIVVDGVVDIQDLLYVLSEWDNLDSPADTNGDGLVNVMDLLNVVGMWGNCP